MVIIRGEKCVHQGVCCLILVDSTSFSHLLLHTSTFTNFRQQIQDDQCFNVLLWWCYFGVIVSSFFKYMCTFWKSCIMKENWNALGEMKMLIFYFPNGQP